VRDADWFFERPCLGCDPRTAASEVIRWPAEIEKEQKRPVRWLNVADPSRRQLSAELGERACARFLEATRTVILEVVRGLWNLAAEDEAPEDARAR
jgi:hypothetical protein